MLKLYTEKGDKDKIVAIIDEMKRYKQIRLIPGQWGQDNRDWLVDKENNTISQSLSSIKFVSQQTAESLYELSKQKVVLMGVNTVKTKEKDEEGNFIYETTEYSSSINLFTDLLRAVQMNTSIKKNEIEILIYLGYFNLFGNNKKLLNIFNEFFEGKNKLTKIIKSFSKRLELIRDYELSLENDSLSIQEQLLSEYENIGLCLSVYPSAPNNAYYVQEVDTTYSIKIKLYSVKRGTVGMVKMRKTAYANHPIQPNQCIFIDDGKTEQRYSYKDGRRIAIQGEYDYWLSSWHTMG